MFSSGPTYAESLKKSTRQGVTNGTILWATVVQQRKQKIWYDDHKSSV